MYVLLYSCILLLFFTYSKEKDTYFDKEYGKKSYIENIPHDILEIICSKLSIMDTLSIRKTNKFFTVLKAICNKRIAMQYEQVIRNFPNHILEKLPGAIWIDLEWIDFNDKWINNDNFIKIEKDDVLGHPFKYCRDTHGRLMLIMRRKEDVAVLYQCDLHTWKLVCPTLPSNGCKLSESMVANISLSLSYTYADF